MLSSCLFRRSRHRISKYRTTLGISPQASDSLALGRHERPANNLCPNRSGAPMSAEQSTEQDQLIIDTPLGRIRGIRRPVEGRDDVTSFMGIPFAQAPVGDLRFAAPVPVGPWDGIRDALAFGPTPQRGDPGVTLIPEPSVPGESTLNLNVTTPAAGRRRRRSFRCSSGSTAAASSPAPPPAPGTTAPGSPATGSSRSSSPTAWASTDSGTSPAPPRTAGCATGSAPLNGCARTSPRSAGTRRRSPSPASRRAAARCSPCWGCPPPAGSSAAPSRSPARWPTSACRGPRN